MSTEQQQPLAKVEQKERFVTKPGLKYAHKGREHDLRTIDTRTAEALAEDPSCKFLQWADGEKRPKGQEAPLPVRAAGQQQAPINNEQGTEGAGELPSGKSAGKGK